MAKKFSDQQIIESIKTGREQETLKYLYNRCLPKIKAYISANSGDKDDALDIFQDAILVLCKQVKENKFNISFEIDGFIYSVSRNLWINKMKKESNHHKFQENHYPSIEKDDFSDYIITKENEDMIRNILEKLGEKCVQLLQFSIYYRYSNREIQKRMKFTSEDAVKTQKYKCKQKLIKLMETYPAVKELIN